MAHPVNWFQIQGKDGAALQAFYQAAFGWRMSPSPDGGMMMVAPEEGGIPGGVGATQDGSERAVSIYVSVGDLGDALKRIEDAGGKAAMHPMELPGGMGWIAGFADPAGNWIGLWQPPAAPATPPAEKGKKPKGKKAKRAKKAEKATKKAAKAAAAKAAKGAAKATKKSDKKKGKARSKVDERA